ncbi:MAG: hypothetical protein ACD_60C00120G0024 [uncultured bacterium]|nr:MAG: hypothetical protein ACD_60C00120G0024 [uncultured bacterium]
MKPDAQEKLQALFIAYTKKLPDKISHLVLQGQDLIKKFDREKLYEFHRAIHSLCGSSGTYGYHHLCRAARELEVCLREFLNNESLTFEQRKEISRLLDKIKTIPLALKEEKPSLTAMVDFSLKNKLIYVLDDGVEFVNELKSHFDLMGYELQTFKDFAQFKNALSKIKPIALIIDSKHLGAHEITHLQHYQQHEAAIPLFVTSKQSDLLTRLKAIRAGSTAFFPKPAEAFYLAKTVDQTCASSSSEPLRVLVVDDSQSLADYYALILEEAGMEARALMNPLHVLDVLTEFRPNLLLLDIYMPECSGVELAAVLRQEPLYASIPIIFLSTEDNRFKQLAALRLGGDDFLTKPILPEHLVSAVRSRAERAGILSSYMTRDSLTNLLNHTNILQHLEIEVARAARFKTPLSFLMIDIDHFKLVNDTHGHLMGDRVLRKLSELLVTHLRKTDFVGRYGGEEFAVVLPDTESEAAITLCKNIRELFSQIVFKTGAREFHVTLSAGIASFPKVRGAKNLIEAADKALYQAKHEGRNREREVFFKI